MIWVPLMDNNGKIRGIKDASTGQRIVRWDGIADPLTDWGQVNARIILAAPEMMDALERIIAIIRRGGTPYKGSEEHIDAIAAINKAKGE